MESITADAAEPINVVKIVKTVKVFKGSMDVLNAEKLLHNSQGSLYRLVRLAMVRALELADGKPSLIKNPMSEKLATIALQEISQGKVVLAAGPLKVIKQ